MRRRSDMKRHSVMIAVGIGVCASFASAQEKWVAFVVDDDDPVGEPIDPRSVDAGLAVSPGRVITTANQYVTLYTRSGSLIEEWHASESGFPFKRVDTDDGLLFDPRIEYDTVNGRFWMIYSEQKPRASRTIPSSRRRSGQTSPTPRPIPRSTAATGRYGCW
ncbi:MAG: hypothetical protein ACF8R7_07410 [Phycisphaerales bacterium JB039]